MAVLAEVTSCVPALTPSVAKCYGTRPADVFFRMDAGETRTITCPSGVQQGDPMGPATFCLALRPGLTDREGYVVEGVEAFACFSEVSPSVSATEWRRVLVPAGTSIFGRSVAGWASPSISPGVCSASSTPNVVEVEGEHRLAQDAEGLHYFQRTRTLSFH